VSRFTVGQQRGKPVPISLGDRVWDQKKTSKIKNKSFAQAQKKKGEKNYGNATERACEWCQLLRSRKKSRIKQEKKKTKATYAVGVFP